MRECYQLADTLDPLLKPQNQSKADKDKSNKSTEKLNDKKHKAKPKKNDNFRMNTGMVDTAPLIIWLL
jgi:hypothetical protein